jgi:two-component system, NarL family, response regulator NreC
MGIRILLADDHEIVRNGLRALFERESGMDVVGEAENGRVAVALAKKLRPDVVILDIGMPDLNGIEAARQIGAAAPGVKILALSMHSDRRYVAGMLKAGASGYLLKESAFRELVIATRVIANNQRYLSPKITDVVLKDYLEWLNHSETTCAPGLSPREREVLQLLAEGKSRKQIALDLKLSLKTVETHCRRIMKKLDLHSVADLTRYAIQEGLISMDG